MLLRKNQSNLKKNNLENWRILQKILNLGINIQ